MEGAHESQETGDPLRWTLHRTHPAGRRHTVGAQFPWEIRRTVTFIKVVAPK